MAALGRHAGGAGRLAAVAAGLALAYVAAGALAADGRPAAAGSAASTSQAAPKAGAPAAAGSAPAAPRRAASAASSSTVAARTAPSAPAGSAPAGDPGDAWPAGRTLLIPVEGVAASELRDTFDQRRGNRLHEAIDIAAPRGTPVRAVDDGRVAKLFTSVPGGLTVYQFDRDDRHAYYYAHLDGYAEGLKEGMTLARGDLIGYVGITGNSAPDTPHLHFAVFRLGPERRWWQGTPINPYPLMAKETPR